MTAIIKITPANITFNAVENRTILDSALSSNIALEHSCKNGSCGLCETTIIQGEVTDAQGNVFMAGQKFLTCQCQCRSEILTIEAEYHPELSGQVRKVVPCKVVAATQYQDFLTIKFRLPPTANFNYLPGQYINLSYQGITRSYSVASANTTSGLELHIRRVNDGAMSQLLFDNEIKPDTLMRLDGPIGTFFIRADTRPIIFLAGGTGFAPVKAMVEHIIAQGCTRQIHIYWGMNSSKDFYSELPTQWARQHSHIQFEPIVSGEDNAWIGRTGFVHQAVLQDIPNLAEYCVYACGSPLMIAAAKRDFIEHGLMSKQFYSDAFTVSK